MSHDPKFDVHSVKEAWASVQTRPKHEVLIENAAREGQTTCRLAFSHRKMAEPVRDRLMNLGFTVAKVRVLGETGEFYFDVSW